MNINRSIKILILLSYDLFFSVGWFVCLLGFSVLFSFHFLPSGSVRLILFRRFRFFLHGKSKKKMSKQINKKKPAAGNITR